jgi:hypothetical protein
MAHEKLETLMTAMEREAEAFDNCIEAQRKFAQALESRDWPGLTRAMEALEERSREISRVEADRITAESFMRLDLGLERGGILEIAMAISEPERTRLTDLHRRLRISAMRVRLENGSLGDYAAASRSLLGTVLEELFPEKKGNIYGKSGRVVHPGHDAILVNTAL